MQVYTLQPQDYAWPCCKQVVYTPDKSLEQDMASGGNETIYEIFMWGLVLKH